MQTTLLGFAFAIILALVAALAAPLFVNWESYRDDFEARASNLTGLQFKIAGAIDARLLPTPSLVLHGVEFGRRGDPAKVRARALRLEFALGSLVRGEWKISDARLEGPEITGGLDGSGRLALPIPSAGSALDGVSIQRLIIEDGRATLTDAATQSRLVLDKFEFKGEIRSLAGPAKGEGSFMTGGQHYPYRFSVGRLADDGSVKLRVIVDPIDRALTADADLSVSIENGVPRFEGNLTFARPVGRAPEGASALIVESWRLTSHIKGNSTAAMLDQLEFQFGPDDRAVKLRGEAKLALGAKPQLDARLSSPQVDLDRMLALPEATRKRPLTAIKTFADYFSGALRVPLPTRLGVTAETVTLAGASLQRANAEFKIDGDIWDIESLEFRTPGITQVRLSGRVGVTPKGVSFKGPVRVDSGDPRVLLAWLTDRPDTQPAVAGSLRIGGDLTLSADEIAVDGLKADFDRMAILGRFAYGWASQQRPARIDAALTAPELDVDRFQALAKSVFDETSFDWPREGRLSIKVARALVAGVEAKQNDVSMRIDANGVEIERFAVADFGGATLAVKGRIDTKTQPPRGALTLDLDARAIDGVAAVLEKLAPQTADELRRTPGRFSPLALRASLSLDPPAARASTATARFKADGRAGAFRLALQGDATAPGQSLTIENLSALKTANVKVAGRVEVDDARTVVELVGLDRFIVTGKQPGRLSFAASGPLDGKLTVDGQLLAGGSTFAANGTAQLPEGAPPTAALTIKMSNANVRSLRPATAGKPAESVPATLTGKLALANDTVTFTELAGSIANVGVAGRLTVGMAKHSTQVEGEFELGGLDVPAALAAAMGMPQSTGAALWPTEPFDAGLVKGYSGQIRFKAARAMLAPKLLARDARAVLRVSDGELSVQDIDAEVAGGRVAGELSAQRTADGLAARGRLKFTGANAAELLPADGLISGRINLDLMAEGSGRSATALVGSLTGGGSFNLENGRMDRIDPAVFEALTRAVDAGLPIDAARVRAWIEKALPANVLPVAKVEGAITISAGQARLSSLILRTQVADLSASGSLDLSEGALDARLTLFGPPGTGGVASTRPEIAIALKGPIAAPKRSVDVAALSTWLALRAVEQQSKKLEALEGRATSPTNAAPREAAVEQPPRAAPIEQPPQPPKVRIEQPPPKARSEPPPSQNAPAVSRPVPPAATQVETSPAKPAVPRPPASPLPASPPTAQKPPPRPAEQARPLPPPVNILPFLAPRT